MWVTQAIAINREVGGNLAEVLDGVGQTIRERNQIRRQVKALAAEGKLSAYVLAGAAVRLWVPFISNPSYIGTSPRARSGGGWIAAGVVMLIVGGFKVQGGQHRSNGAGRPLRPAPRTVVPASLAQPLLPRARAAHR